MAGEKLPTYRYRLTVEVMTPEGVRSGSSVIQVNTRRFGEEALPDARGYRKQVEGEAVAVDLGRRGVLFALLRNQAGESWPEYAMETVLPTGPRETQQKKFNAVMRLRGVYELPRLRGTGATQLDNYPIFVRFEDPRRPDSAVLIDPDRLDASFGAGVALRRITLERTETPVTHNLHSYLPFLNEKDTEVGIDRTFEGSPASQQIGLARSNFKRNF